jgi:hypothetical protein
MCLAPHMASLTFPVKVWVLPTATPGTTANPVLSTTVAIQTCDIRRRDPLLFSALAIGCVRIETRIYFLTSKTPSIVLAQLDPRMTEQAS